MSLITSLDHRPIRTVYQPDGQWWHAWWDDLEGEQGPRGHGPTEQAAVADLLEESDSDPPRERK